MLSTTNNNMATPNGLTTAGPSTVRAATTTEDIVDAVGVLVVVFEEDTVDTLTATLHRLISTTSRRCIMGLIKLVRSNRLLHLQSSEDVCASMRDSGVNSWNMELNATMVAVEGKEARLVSCFAHSFSHPVGEDGREGNDEGSFTSSFYRE